MRHSVVPVELTRGPFTIGEAREAGLTWKQLQGASWRRIGVGLYVAARLAEAPLATLTAARRRLPPEAVFAGRTAAWLHGLDLPPCDPVEVAIPRACGVSARAGVDVRRTDLPSHDVETRRGLPVTSALRTLIDLAQWLPEDEAVVALDMALHRRLVELGDLDAFVVRKRGRKGVSRLRQVLQLVEPAAESAMETRLRLLLVRAGLPRPEAQVPLYDERGRFVGRPDLYYPAARLGLECDGGIHRDSLVKDNRRQNRLVNAGYRLLRFTAVDLRHSPQSVIAGVRAALHGTSA